MARANFFDRAATAASQVLNGFDLASFEAVLGNHVVGVAFDGAAAMSTEGRAALDLTVRLAARLYPNLAILPLEASAADMAAMLCNLARSINPEIGLSKARDGITRCVVVGDTAAGLDAPCFYAGSQGWIAKLSMTEPVGSGASANPFGAGAAACLAAANVFRTVFADQLTDGGPDADLTLSTFDFGRTAHDPDFGPVDVGETHLVGLGAVGNGAVWALARLPGMTGDLHLVDHEDADLSNLQRYVMTGQDGVDQPKVEIAAEALARTSLRVVPHRLPWDGYVQQRGDWRLDRVVVALDTAKDRLAVQGTLPRRILNAWTGPDDLGVSRHGFADGKACLACLYLPSGKVEDEDVRVARELGIPEAFMQVRILLATGAPVDGAFVATVAERLGVPFDALQPFVGQPLRTFYGRALCGGLVFRLTGGARGDRATVPMAFQSALAGIMLAAELVKDAGGMAAAPTVVTRLNLTRPLAQYLHDPRAPDRSGRCLCCDTDFVGTYRRKYAAGSASVA